MESNKMGQGPGGAKPTDRYTPTPKTPTAPLKLPTAGGTGPLPSAKAAKDNDATSEKARSQAEQAAGGYERLLQGADRENKGMDAAFGKFQARKSQENADKLREGKEAAQGEGAKAGATPAGAQQVGSTGTVFQAAELRKVEEKEPEPEKDGDDEEPPEMAQDANETQERQLTNELSDAQKAQYEMLATLLATDAEARRGLQALLLDGLLPGEDLDAEEHNLLYNLAALAEMPLEPSIAPAKIVADVVADLAAPDALAAAAASVSPLAQLVCAMAATRKAEYARLIRGLASLEGEVLLANGKPLRRLGELEPTEGRWSSLLLHAAMEGYAAET
ncbi:MAG: hypothetical protein JWM80_2324 [Cyanobacteria bacterium RYN_339]|nr:hypothetical protein [Cyanobacteria bacterium RYN_339]